MFVYGAAASSSNRKLHLRENATFSVTSFSSLSVLRRKLIRCAIGQAKLCNNGITVVSYFKFARKNNQRFKRLPSGGAENSSGLMFVPCSISFLIFKK